MEVFITTNVKKPLLLLVYTMAIVTSWSYTHVRSVFAVILATESVDRSSTFLPVGIFRASNCFLVLGQVNTFHLFRPNSSSQVSSSQVFPLPRGTPVPQPHVALSFWLQLLSVLLCSDCLSCCSLVCRRLDLTGRTITVRMQVMCKQKYQDLRRQRRGIVSVVSVGLANLQSEVLSICPPIAVHLIHQ